MAKEYDALLTEILASASSAAATAAATILARCLTYRSKYFERKVIKCLPGIGEPSTNAGTPQESLVKVKLRDLERGVLAPSRNISKDGRARRSERVYAQMVPFRRKRFFFNNVYVN